MSCRSYKLNILSKLTDIIPGLIGAWLLLADIHLEMDSYKEAEIALRYVLSNLDETNSIANLMLSRILIQQVFLQFYYANDKTGRY